MFMTRLNFWTLFSSTSPFLIVSCTAQTNRLQSTRSQVHSTLTPSPNPFNGHCQTSLEDVAFQNGLRLTFILLLLQLFYQRFYYYHYHLRYHYRHCYHHHLMLCAIGLYMYCRRRSRNDCFTICYNPLGKLNSGRKPVSEAPHCSSYSMRLSLNYFGVLFLVASICRFGGSDSYNSNAL